MGKKACANHRVCGRKPLRRRTRGFGVSRGVGRYVCAGNYYIITQISRWLHSLRCRYPVLWPRAKGDSGPGRCLEMVRGVPIRLIHVYYEVTFYRRASATNRSYKIARKNCTRNYRFRDPTFPPRILGDRRDATSIRSLPFSLFSFSLNGIHSSRPPEHSRR